MDALLSLQNLRKYYATQKAVDDISFTIERGSIFGLLGPNGAGKTTLLRMITGIFYPDVDAKPGAGQAGREQNAKSAALAYRRRRGDFARFIGQSCV